MHGSKAFFFCFFFSVCYTVSNYGCSLIQNLQKKYWHAFFVCSLPCSHFHQNKSYTCIYLFICFILCTFLKIFCSKLLKKGLEKKIVNACNKRRDYIWSVHLLIISICVKHRIRILVRHGFVYKKNYTL